MFRENRGAGLPITWSGGRTKKHLQICNGYTTQKTRRRPGFLEGAQMLGAMKHLIFILLSFLGPIWCWPGFRKRETFPEDLGWLPARTGTILRAAKPSDPCCSPDGVEPEDFWPCAQSFFSPLWSANHYPRPPDTIYISALCACFKSALGAFLQKKPLVPLGRSNCL